MKIVQITAGTGNFYCGACLRDATLVKGLRRLGHDAIMIPLYLPTVEEDEDVAEDTVYLGGINAFLQQKWALFRHTPRWLDRLFDSKRLLRHAARYSGMTHAEDLGAMTCSTLEGRDGRQRKEIDRLLDHLEAHEQPDVVVLSNVLLAGFAPAVKARFDVPVICTMQGEDAFLDGLPAPYAERAWARLRELVADHDLFVGVSEYYGELMQRRMQIPDEKLAVVYNGIGLDDYDVPRTVTTPTVGYLSQLIRNKGLHTTVDAFLLLKKRGSVAGLRLEVAGSTVPGGERFLQEIRQRIEDSGHSADVRIRENVSKEDKIRHLAAASVFTAPATYGESFGLYVIEALAAGTPVVQPRHAAFPELIERSGGGLLCEPDDAASLADTLETLLLDEARARALGDAGREAVRRDFSADAMSRSFDALLQRLASSPESPAPSATS